MLVSARRFPGLGVVSGETPEIAELSPIDAAPRHLQAVEMDDDDEIIGQGEQITLALPESGTRRGTGA